MTTLGVDDVRGQFLQNRSLASLTTNHFSRGGLSKTTNLLWLGSQAECSIETHLRVYRVKGVKRSALWTCALTLKGCGQQEIWILFGLDLMEPAKRGFLWGPQRRRTWTSLWRSFAPWCLARRASAAEPARCCCRCWRGWGRLGGASNSREGE